MKIIADKDIPFLFGVFEPFCDIEYFHHSKINNQIVLGADVLIIRTRTICNAELLKGSKVKFIASATIGFDHIDVDYCKKEGISWKNSPGCNSGAVKQWFMSAIFALIAKQNMNIRDITLGVVGVGHVGSKVASFAEAIGLRVLLNDPPRERVEGNCNFRVMQSIIRECNLISFHVPLIHNGPDKTFHLVNQSFIESLQPGTMLINCSRGEVIDTNAFLSVGKKKKLKAVLDVFENEPSISQELASMASIITPHIAGYSIEGKANATTQVVQRVAEYLEIPLNDWQPDYELPGYLNQLVVDAKNKENDEVMAEVICRTYAVEKDDALLRKNLNNFENIRSSYVYRYEPQDWTIGLLNGGAEIIQSLKAIGFQVKAVG
ncbi:MAG: 4-phosphoerythronate dehydrogenase [Bacteroidota bacterium]|nr:MAG: 4-phosphoerythronate dehydrogenase [Bacteroidota bacterium]